MNKKQKSINRRSFLLLGLSSSFALSADVKNRVTWQWPCMGSSFKCSFEKAGSVVSSVAIQELLEKIELTFSVHRADSEVLSLCRQANSQPGRAIPVSEDLYKLTKLSVEYAKRTQGYFDITVGPLTNYWRYQAATNTLPDSQKVDLLKKRVGWHQLELEDQSIAFQPKEKTVLLDYGGVAKGYAIDRVIELLKNAGVESAVVELGGEIRILGSKIHKVQLLDRNGNIYGEPLKLKEGALSTSGDLYQSIRIDGEHRSHIVSKNFPEGGRKGHAITVSSDTGVVADILSTAMHAAYGSSAFPEIIKLCNKYWVT